MGIQLAFLRKLEGYRRRFIYEWKQCFAHRDEKRAERAFDRWLRQLMENPPDVLIGANFAAYGGVRNHIQAIQRNSRMQIELAPPESLVKNVGLYRIQMAFRDRFFAINASKSKALHSHVFPWYIDWCRHQQISNRARWIHTYHLMYYPEHGNGKLEPWQQEINDSLLNTACHADVCLSVSKWQCHELRSKHGIEATYLPNGVDVNVCERANPDRFRKKICLDRFILYVGRNDPVKNPGEFVELARRLPEEKFVMIGGGLDVSTVTESCGVPPENLRILGGMSQLEVQDAIAACSVLVVTSKREGLPTLVLEAMVHETPLVVPDEAGCIEAVSDGKYAKIYRLGDPEDLRQMTLAAHSQGRHDRGARLRVLEEFDWRRVVQKLDRVYTA
jgi:glycosyltransferase involved in cell wall biosynthesis